MTLITKCFFRLCAGMLILFCFAATGCGGKHVAVSEAATSSDTATLSSPDITPKARREKPTPLNVSDVFYPAEKAQLKELAIYTSSHLREHWASEPLYITKYTGEGYVGFFESESCRITFDVKIDTPGFYDLVFMIQSPHFEGLNLAFLNDVHIDTFLTPHIKDSFEEVSIQRVYLEQGTHRIGVGIGYGAFAMDGLWIKASKDKYAGIDIFDVSPVPINPNADDNAKRLMKFIADNYGTRIISGQTTDPPRFHETDALYALTGDMPAIIAMEFGALKYPSHMDVLVQAAKDWDSKGAIVNFHWHWVDFIEGHNFYNEGVDLDAVRRGIMDPNSTERQKLLHDIDLGASYLAQLRDAGVPVLWRPLHEAEGRWFWWGHHGPEVYKTLWNLLYDRMTNHHNLSNLIWCWNAPHEDWYVGDDKCDLASIDMYVGAHKHQSQQSNFYKLVDIMLANGKPKMLFVAELDAVLDIEYLDRDGAMWGAYVLWTHGTVAKMGEGWGQFILDEHGRAQYGEALNSAEIMSRMFKDDRVVTLKKMPNLKTYPLNTK